MKFELVVLGAHIGIHIKDEISKINNSPILLVEPVPHNVDAIKENLKEYKNIVIEPVAISNINEKKDFYFVKGNSINKLKKHWASGIGSFDKQHILNHKSKRFNINEDDIENIEIDFITFDNLIKKYEIDSIDNLQIDVEGAEYEILKTIDFKKTNINSIQFESKHFDGTFTEGPKLKKIKEKLLANGFNLSQLDQENILAKK